MCEDVPMANNPHWQCALSHTREDTLTWSAIVVYAKYQHHDSQSELGFGFGFGLNAN